MSGKFLQIWPLRTVTKTIALIVIILIAVAIYATRKIPENFEDDKEWEFWRSFDFAVCVVSLAFASMLLYGAITEFRMFVLLWMIWDVLFAVVWITFLARKYKELADWERKFRLVAIHLMIFAEIPVFNYFQYLRVKHKDHESNFSWIDAESDKVYKSLDERRSISSIDGIFGRTSGKKNLGFQSDSGRNSVVSVASEEREHRENEEQKMDENEKKITKIEHENEKLEESMEKNEQKQEDVTSQSSFEITVTVHTKKCADAELNKSSAETDNSDSTTESLSPPVMVEANQPGTFSSYSGLEKHAATQGGQNDNYTTDQITKSMDITEDKRENVPAPSATDTGVVIEMEEVGMSLHSECSTSVEIDVTDMTSAHVNNTSF